MEMKYSIYDGSTGETIVRDMTPEEIEQYNQLALESEARRKAMAEDIANRQALLNKLGITEDEARLLLA